MKRKILILLSVSFLFTFASCEKDLDSEGVNTKITYYPTFDMSGDALVFHQLGDVYTDPSVGATEDGVDLQVSVSVTGEFNYYSGATVKGDVPDKYVISYSAVNSDGYPGSVSRTVYVFNTGDLVSSIEGLYVSNVVRTSEGAKPQYQGMEYVMIWKTGANTYMLSNALGGYYSIGRAYGYDYAAQGSVITANDIPGNSFTITNAVIPGFGNTVAVSNFTVNPIAKTISFTGVGNFANATFNVVLTQVQP